MGEWYFSALCFPGLAHADMPCPEGYIYSSKTGSCYRLAVDEYLAYSEAVERCEEEGASLASIQDRLEDAILLGKIAKTIFLSN